VYKKAYTILKNFEEYTPPPPPSLPKFLGTGEYLRKHNENLRKLEKFLNHNFNYLNDLNNNSYGI